MSLIRSSRSEPELWMVWAKPTCLVVRLPSAFSVRIWDRISRLLSGVRSSCDMLARNSDLYLEIRASCSAFSSSATLACSTSWFFCSTSAFWPASSWAFSSSSALVCCSSSCCFLSSSSDFCSERVCCSSRLLVSVSASCCDCRLSVERLRLLQQLLGPHVGGDGVEHDADALGELLQEGEPDLVELVEGGELEHRLDLALEQHRQHDDVPRRRLAQAGADLDVVVRHLVDEHHALLPGALAHQPLAQPELVGDVLAVLVGVAREQLEHGVVAGGVHHVEDAVLRGDQRGQVGEDELRHRRQVALALQHAAELGQVGLEPVLLHVLPRGVAQVADHLVDVVLELRHLALRLDRDGPGEVALGHRRGHVGDGAHLGGQVGGELVHVVGEVAPDAGGARHAGLAAQLAFDARPRGPRWSPGRRTWRACRSCR